MRPWLLFLLEDALSTEMGPHAFCLCPDLNCDGGAKGMGATHLFGMHFSLRVHYRNPVLWQPNNKQLLQPCNITKPNQCYFCSPITIIFLLHYYCNPVIPCDCNPAIAFAGCKSWAAGKRCECWNNSCLCTGRPLGFATALQTTWKQPWQ